MRFLAALLMMFALGARATTPTTDFSDLWFNPNEEGWGMNVIQQNQILFVTLFVYGANNQPTWLVAPITQYNGLSNGVVSFTGPLYTTTGPYFGAGSFPESGVFSRLVGTFTFAASLISAASISYTVDGVPVAKSVQRQTWREETLAGLYAGALSGTYANCGAARDGLFESFVQLSVAHQGGSGGAAGSAITIQEQGLGYVCNYAGTYQQSGRMGQITGTGSCDDGTTQTFTATEIQGGLTGLTMRVAGTFSASNCTFTGRMGGVRRSN